MRASLPANLPWIRALLIVGGDGRIQCATNNLYIGLDLADRPYFKKARETRNFVLSDFLLARPTGTPIVMAAYPVSAINRRGGLRWFSPPSVSTGCRSIMSNLAGRPASRPS